MKMGFVFSFSHGDVEPGRWGLAVIRCKCEVLASFALGRGCSSARWANLIPIVWIRAGFAPRLGEVASLEFSGVTGLRITFQQQYGGRGTPYRTGLIMEMENAQGL